MLISPAYAQAAAPGGGFDIVSILPLILIFAVFYFLLIRPQQKRMKKHKEMQNNLKRGDRILTGGGILGRIVKVEGDDILFVEIAPEVKVRLARTTVAELVGQGEPVSAAANDAGSKGGGGHKRVGLDKKRE